MTTIYDADILLVDDNPDLLALVARIASTAGFTRLVLTASSCADAKTAFAHRRPELMILDIQPARRRRLRAVPRPARRIRCLSAGSLPARDATPDRLFGLGLGVTTPDKTVSLCRNCSCASSIFLQRAYQAELMPRPHSSAGQCHGGPQDAAVPRRWHSPR